MFHSVRISHMTNRYPQNRFVVVPHRALHRRTASQKNPWTCLAMARLLGAARARAPRRTGSGPAGAGSTIGKAQAAGRPRGGPRARRGGIPWDEERAQNARRTRAERAKNTPFLLAGTKSGGGAHQIPSRHHESQPPSARNTNFVTSCFDRTPHVTSLGQKDQGPKGSKPTDDDGWPS